MKAEVQERLIFQSVVEAMFRHGLVDRLTPDYQARLRQLGIDLNRYLPGYPYETWEAALIEATTLFPEYDREAALEALGRRMLNASLEANRSSGKLLPLLRVLGVTRAVKRALASSTGENFNETTFGLETKNSLEVKMSFVGNIPQFALGSMLELVPRLGGKNVRGTMVEYRKPAGRYLLEWD